MSQEKTVEKLLKKIRRKKLKSEYFDDFVHQTASNMASGINNRGLEVQMNYLLDNGWTEKDVIEVFE